MLPNFIIIGAPKAGTTALYWYLAEHPQIHMSRVKETNYFAFGVDDAGQLLYGDSELHRFRVRTLGDYEALFEGAGDAGAVGEASPIYLECPQAAGRIRAVIPEARIICGLRQPVDRAYSDYLMYLRSRGRHFDAARDIAPTAAWASPDSHWMRIGRYHEQLARYFTEFPGSQIHIFLYDDLKRTPTAVVQDIYRFLGIDPTFLPDFDTPHGVGGVPASMALERFLTSDAMRAAVKPLLPKRTLNWARKLRSSNLQPAPPLPADIKQLFTRHFRDDIAKTEALIGRDLSHWL